MDKLHFSNDTQRRQKQQQIRQQADTHLVHIAGQTQQHRKKPLVQFVHRRQTRLSFDHLGALADHVDHQTVEQLAGGNLHRVQEEINPDIQPALSTDLDLDQMCKIEDFIL